MKLLTNDVRRLIATGIKLPHATENYPSRGQTSIQELYQTKQGKLFLKKVSKRNHLDCQIDVQSGTLAEREYWAFRLAQTIDLVVPALWLLDKHTTVQTWLDYPDARLYSTSQAAMKMNPLNVFDCALFDWLTGQIDRHDANYLYDYVEERIILIDSAHSFLRYSGSLPDYLKLYEVANPTELSKHRTTLTTDRIQKLTPKMLNKLVPLREEGERLNLFNRLEVLRSAHSIQDIINLYREIKS